MVYATSPQIGSIDRMYELLRKASDATPIAGNAGGQLATMASNGGITFGVINIVGK